jgi:hypothetical protein
MLEPEFDQLRHRILAREQVAEELRLLSESSRRARITPDEAEDLSDLGNLALHQNLVPSMDAARELVELAVASDTTYPILTNDGLIYDALHREHRDVLAKFVRHRLADASGGHTQQALLDFADDLEGRGPQL